MALARCRQDLYAFEKDLHHLCRIAASTRQQLGRSKLVTVVGVTARFGISVYFWRSPLVIC